MSGALAALRLLGVHWKLTLTGLGFLALGLALLSARAESRRWHEQADRYAALYSAERQAHQQTIDNYRRAAALARAEDQAHAAGVERDQAAVSQEVSNDYQARLAALHARYDALRLQRPHAAAPADPGAGRAADLPKAAQGAAGAAPPAGEEGLSLDDRFLCSAQAEQLDALIDWVERVETVANDADASTSAH